MTLLTMGKGSPKLVKSDKAKLGYLSAIQYLSPHKVSGKNLCTSASPGCAAACLYSAGRGRTNGVQQARLDRTHLFNTDKTAYFTQLYTELGKFARKCDKAKQKPCVRLNGTSDIMWEKVKPSLFKDWSNIQFYDYTKHYLRMIRWCDGRLPKNYHLTFSRSECNEWDCRGVLLHGGNVAVVFETQDLPKKWEGYTVFNADDTDLRFLDKKGVQGLYAKGKAKHDDTGFVVLNTTLAGV